ncbi:MAG: hypothetical protein IBX55_06770 [Methyloprofundus sp.]|nr:hypothetical protein [Methyloprofundus sp.]
MAINTSDLNSALNASTIKVAEPSTTAATPNDTQSTSSSTQQSTDTVTFSAAAIALSNTDNESTKVSSETEIDPRQQIVQLQSNITQDPSQAIDAQAGKITDTAVKSLLG